MMCGYVAETVLCSLITHKSFPITKRVFEASVCALFEKLSDNKAKCTVSVIGQSCGQIIGRGDSNTSSMLHHIRFKHAVSPEAKTLEIKMKNKSNTLKKEKKKL